MKFFGRDSTGTTVVLGDTIGHSYINSMSGVQIEGVIRSYRKIFVPERK